MEESALFISALALVVTVLLAGLGMLFQWLVSRDTRQQATEIRKDVGEFKSEVSGLLGLIQGLTTETRQTQERQVDKMLGALVDRASGATSAGTTPIVARIEALEAGPPPPDKMADELKNVKDMVQQLNVQIPAAIMVGRGRELAIIDHFKATNMRTGGKGQITVGCIFQEPLVGVRLLVCCGVVTPGRIVGAVEPVTVTERHHETTFTFPDDFVNADSETAGEYIVSAEICFSLGSPALSVEYVTFLVE